MQRRNIARICVSLSLLTWLPLGGCGKTKPTQPASPSLANIPAAHAISDQPVGTFTAKKKALAKSTLECKETGPATFRVDPRLKAGFVYQSTVSSSDRYGQSSMTLEKKIVSVEAAQIVSDFTVLSVLDQRDGQTSPYQAGLVLRQTCQTSVSETGPKQSCAISPDISKSVAQNDWCYVNYLGTEGQSQTVEYEEGVYKLKNNQTIPAEFERRFTAGELICTSPTGAVHFGAATRLEVTIRTNSIANGGFFTCNNGQAVFSYDEIRAADGKLIQAARTDLTDAPDTP